MTEQYRTIGPEIQGFLSDRRPLNLNLSFVQNTIEDLISLLGNIETFEMDKYYKLFPD
jgi:hypothetical protein